MLKPGSKPTWHRYLRMGGIGLLVALVASLDLQESLATISSTRWTLLLAALILNLPQISLKALRWWYLMRAANIHYGIGNSVLAYFGGILVGLLTPGRLGEFAKVMYVQHDMKIPAALAMPSALVDRLYDLYFLFTIGAIAAYRSLGWQVLSTHIIVPSLLLTLTTPLILLSNQRAYALVSRIGLRLGRLGTLLFGEGGWGLEVHRFMRKISIHTVIIGSILTVLAYGLFFTQCYLVAMSLSMRVSFADASFAVALGSLAALLPISISGVGTRDAAIIAYLARHGITPEQALSFSLLIFITFHLMGGLLGAFAWQIKSLPSDSRGRHNDHGDS